MDLNEYCVQSLLKQRIAEMHDEVRAANIRAAARRPRRPVRVVAGHLLVRLGNRLLEGFTPARATA